MTPSWIDRTRVLRGRVVALEPLGTEHLDALFEVASDRSLWALTSVDYSHAAVFDASVRAAFRGRDAGTAYAYAIVDNADGRVVGTTRFLDVNAADRTLEIGVTWIARACWGSPVNPECKWLMLAYCFETLRAHRVQFRTRAGNLRSRRALDKIGARFEGVHRKDRIEPDGNARDTAFYSVIDDDWPAVEARLRAQLERGA